MTSDVIIGFLSGSLATEVVREIFHFFTRGYEHKRDLQKLTYQRKLQKAENAMAFYFTYYERVVEIKHAYEVYIKELDEISLDTEAIENIIDKSQQLLEDLNHDKHLNIKSIYLYFDFEDDSDWKEEDAAMITQALVDAAKVQEQIRTYMQLGYKEDNTEEQIQKYWLKAIDIMPELVEHLKRIVKLLEKSQEYMRGTLNNIKRQMKMY
jgi:hypothetical protein